MYSIFDVANYIIEKLGTVSHKKLQKLCYYVYSWYIYLYNDSVDEIENRLFDNDFEAWVHGAVSPALYYKLKHSDDIFNIEQKDLGSDIQKIKKDELVTYIDSVLEEYGKYSANELENINHQELPWLNQRKGLGTWDNCNNKIQDRDIFFEYAQRS